MRESVIYQEIEATADAEGFQRGIQQGIEQGIQQGIEQGIEQERAFVFRLLNHRVGAVTSELREQVKALPLDKLEDLGEALLDFRSEADLQAWLRAH